MTLKKLLAQIANQAETIDFNDVIETINTEYSYTPSKFTNGKGANMVANEQATNEGSCKIFAFAQLNNLTKEQTLACFGTYYRDDVLKHPEATDHANIRTLMLHSLADIVFENMVLKAK